MMMDEPWLEKLTIAWSNGAWGSASVVRTGVDSGLVW